MSEAQGVIATVEVDGLPVIYRYVDEDPSDERRERLQWLTVISWSYDESVRNGMPPEDVNAAMVQLEDAISEGVESPGFCEHVVSKTGNGLKELIYYIHDRETFIARFNDALAGHPPYPIEIDWYHDPEWKEFALTRGIFDGTDKGAEAAAED